MCGLSTRSVETSELGRKELPHRLCQVNNSSLETKSIYFDDENEVNNRQERKNAIKKRIEASTAVPAIVELHQLPSHAGEAIGSSLLVSRLITGCRNSMGHIRWH